MKELGEIIAISASGKAICRNPETPPKNAQVRDEKGHTRGRIVRIVGPTRNPFILIDGSAKVGEKVFL